MFSKLLYFYILLAPLVCAVLEISSRTEFIEGKEYVCEKQFNEQDLKMMSFDPINNVILVTTSSRIFEINSLNMKITKSESIVNWLKTNGGHFVLNVLNHTNKTVIACGKHNGGTCFNAPQDIQSQDEPMTSKKIKPLADNVHFKLARNQLLIANNPPVSQPNEPFSFINIYNIANGFTQIAEVPALEAIQTTVINSFKKGKYWYVFINKENSAHILQICNDGKSLAEVELVCGKDAYNYNHIISIDIHNNLLYGIFRKHDQEEAAFCHYAFDKIEKDFKDVVEECMMGGQQGYGQMAKTSAKYSQYTEQCNSGHPNDFCRVEIYISSKHTVQISDNAFLKLDKMPSAMLGDHFKNAFVVFLAFNDQLFKLNISKNGHVTKYQQMNFYPPQPNHLILFDNYQDLIVLREKEICKVERAECEYDTCGECVSDPHCVWCLNNRIKKCTLEATCMTNQMMKDKCPSITTITPPHVTFDLFDSQKFVLHTSNIGGNGGEFKCRLRYARQNQNGKDTIEEQFVDAFPDQSKFICNEFQRPHIYYAGKQDVNISLLIDTLEWGTASVILYDCGKFSRYFSLSHRTINNSCTGCLSFQQCSWCLTKHTCQSKEEVCPPHQISGYAPDPSLSDPSKCPYIKEYPSNTKKRFASGEEFTYRIQTYNFPSQSNLKCRFSIDDEYIYTTATMGGGGVVTCDKTMLTYSSNKANITVPVDLVENEFPASDNPEEFTIELYKCHIMENYCGKCNLLIQQQYDCVWCLQGDIEGKASKDYCGHSGSCAQPLSYDSYCQNPAVDKMHPPGGPLEGGTLLSIEGENLGMKPSDVDVTVDGSACDVIPRLYEPAKRIVCRTPANKVPGGKTVLVKINNKYDAHAPKFFYETFQTTTLDNNKGLSAGGTLITIYGSNLHYGSDVVVTFADQPATVIERTKDHLIVQTPKGEQGKVPVKIQVDNGPKVQLPQVFEYLKNPTNLDFNPGISLMAGGREIKLENYRWLNTVTSVVMHIYTSHCSYHNNCSFASLPCRFERHEFICYTPAVETPVDDSGYRNFKVVFKLDNYYYPSKEGNDANFIKYYSDPEFEQIPSNIRIHDINAPFGIIFGKNSRCNSEIMHDGWVMVGGEKCSKVKCGEDDLHLTFNPSECENTKHGGLHSVEIVVDNFHANVGKLAFPKQGLAGGAIAGIVILVLLVLVAVLIALVCFYRRKLGRSSQSNKPPGIDSVNIQANTSLKENPYNSAPGSEEEPLKSEYLNPNSFLNDEQYLNALLERLDNQSIRNAAKEIYIARERLELGNQLGKGHFGKVHAATLRDVNLKDPCLVAVKTIDDPDMDQKMIEGFLKEGVIMKNFNHPHVLNLIGLCLGFRKEPMVVLPFMANGDLRSYVKDKKRSFTARQLLKLAQQVCEGMSYLSSLNFIHRDLAARNCMIDDKSQVKVADFGLSHQLHDSEYYSSKNRKAKLPIKWMALESLENYVFTTKSDVWSFGVLLWELMTRGVTPYPDVDVFETRTYLASGRRLYKPKFCPDNVYSIMTECWQELPERRPSFTDLVNRIEILLNPPKARKEGSNYINVKDEEYAQDYLKPNVGEERKETVA